MVSRVVRTRMGDEPLAEFERLMERLGVNNESNALKQSVALSHHFLDHIERTVPQSVFETYLTKLKYGQKPYKGTPPKVIPGI